MGEHALSRALEGDETAFSELVDPYRRELQLHCYRILGSLPDAEDQLQETLLAAWRGLDGFEGRASLRAWLYRLVLRDVLGFQTIEIAEMLESSEASAKAALQRARATLAECMRS